MLGSKNMSFTFPAGTMGLDPMYWPYNNTMNKPMSKVTSFYWL